MSVRVRSARLLTPISTRPRDFKRAACAARTSKSAAVRVALITTKVSGLGIGYRTLSVSWHGRLAHAARRASGRTKDSGWPPQMHGRGAHATLKGAACALLPFERPRPRERFRAPPVRPPPQRLQRPGDRVVIVHADVHPELLPCLALSFVQVRRRDRDLRRVAGRRLDAHSANVLRQLIAAVQHHLLARAVAAGAHRDHEDVAELPATAALRPLRLAARVEADLDAVLRPRLL